MFIDLCFITLECSILDEVFLDPGAYASDFLNDF
jgi:hypothetical protein